MGAQFGKLFTDTADLVLSAPGMTQNGMRLFIWLLRFAKRADQLEGLELSFIESWASGRALQSIQVAQFSKKSASGIFNGNATEAQRQIDRLVRCGILEKIGMPSKGHAQLYVIHQVGDTSKCDLNSPTKTEKVTSECDPKTIEVTSSQIWGHIRAGLGSHAEAVNCNDISYSYKSDIQSESASAAAAEKAAPPRCPLCGEPTERTNTYKHDKRERLYRCTACFEEVWSRQ